MTTADPHGSPHDHADDVAHLLRTLEAIEDGAHRARNLVLLLRTRDAIEDGARLVCDLAREARVAQDLRRLKRRLERGQ